MADNVVASPGIGGDTFAADDIGGVKYPRGKVAWGADGTANDADVAAGMALPVQLRDTAGAEILGTTTDAASASGAAERSPRSCASSATTWPPCAQHRRRSASS
jgi:hypothetical protein